MKPFVRRLAMIGAIGVVSSSLVVGVAVPANAFDIGPIAKEAAKIGTRVGAGATAGFVVSNPIGWAVGGGMLAWAAYDTRDLWLPLLTGDKGMDDYIAADPAYVGDSATDGGNVNSRMTVGTPSITGPTANLLVTFADGYQAGYYDYTVFFSTGIQAESRIVPTGAKDRKACTNDITGETVVSNWTGADYASNRYHQEIDSWNHPLPMNLPIKFCADGETVAGFQILPRLQDGNFIYQDFETSYGTLFQSPVPEGVVDFGKYLVDVECFNGSTGMTEHLTSYTDNADGGAGIPSCRGRLGDGWRLRGLTITPDAPTIEGQPLPPDFDVPDFAPWEWDELIPELDVQPCMDAPDGCALEVWIDGKPCYEIDPLCKTWTTVKEKEPSRVSCKWGIKPVDISLCLPLMNFYNPDTTTTVTPTPTTTTGPGTTTGVDTITAPTAPAEPGDAAQQTECFPSGWKAFNPFEWVLKPVKCALTWAFVPHPAGWGWSGLVDQAQTRPPLSIFAGLASAVTAFASSYQGSGDCGVLADFSSSDMPNAAITCAQIRSVPGFGGLYAVVQAGLFALTGLGVWKMFSGVLEDGQ